MLGAPGAGKGTQATLLAKNTGLPHISSGEIFRENIKNETDLGKLAKKFIDKGELVTDDVTIAMIKDRLSRPDCVNGSILDGFPRTTTQAIALNEILQELKAKVDVVTFMNVADEDLIERLSGRWTCRESGHIYNSEFNPPIIEGVCDIDGSELYHRDDDEEHTVKNRIVIYRKLTAPLIDHYREIGILQVVDGSQNIDHVNRDIMKFMLYKSEL